jgi:hypothetical protein
MLNAHTNTKKRRVSLILLSDNNIETEIYRDCWLGDAKMIASPANFLHGNSPFVFVDIIHPVVEDSTEDPATRKVIAVSLNFHDIQRSITICSSM